MADGAPNLGAAYAFTCTACGKCCNSGPQLSVPELFHHERRFVGTLGLRRVRAVQAGEALAGVGMSRDDERAAQALAAAQLFALPGTSDHLLLATQALYEPAAARCPALRPDQGCAIHHDRKPVTCSVTPLDAWLPDRLQGHVLKERARSAVYLGADCIREKSVPRGPDLLVRRLEVLQPSYKSALAQRRADLALEKRMWGAAVFEGFARELVSDARALARIPYDGFAAIAPAPVIAVLAAVSEPCRLRCLRFLAAQRALLEQDPSTPSSERHALHRAAVGQLRSLSQAPVSRRAAHADATEAWLGL